MAKDPVCGSDIEEQQALVTAKYKGKQFYFCARSCLDQFVEEPKKFAGKESMMNVPRDDFTF